MIAASSMVIVVALSLAISLAVQNHNERELEAQIEQSESELRVVGAQIADIKDHQFGTMSEYIEAYARIEPLLNTYDQKLNFATWLKNEIGNRD